MVNEANGVVSNTSVQGEKPRILVFDDDEDHLYLLKRLLEKKGFEVVTAVVGTEELNDLSQLNAILEKIQPAAVITDFDMIKFNGSDLKKSVNIWNPKTPVILYSGNPDTGHIARQEGFLGVVLKAGWDDINRIVALLNGAGIMAPDPKSRRPQ